MPKSLKPHPSIFAAILSLMILAVLLPGRGQKREEGAEQESRRERVERAQDLHEREPQQDRSGGDRELRGIVKEVDREKGRITVELSWRDSERFERAVKKVDVDRETRIRKEDNSRGGFSSIMEGAPVKVKVDRESLSEMGSASPVLADKIELEIACKDGQGCPKNGECKRRCNSDPCSCPLPKSSSSSKN